MANGFNPTAPTNLDVDLFGGSNANLDPSDPRFWTQALIIAAPFIQDALSGGGASQSGAFPGAKDKRVQGHHGNWL